MDLRARTPALCRSGAFAEWDGVEGLGATAIGDSWCANGVARCYEDDGSMPVEVGALRSCVGWREQPVDGIPS
jgi:hypothetical protein